MTFPLPPRLTDEPMPSELEREALGATEHEAVDPAPPFVPAFITIGPITSERKLREWALVLQSMSIECSVHHDPTGLGLVVRREDEASARSGIARYEAENRGWPPRIARERLAHPRSLIMAAAFAALAAFLMTTGPASGGSRWFQRGAAVSASVLSAEPWRAVTALTLHADAAHVMGNVISGTIFGSAVGRRIGPGAALFAVLAAGIGGNVANALFHQAMGQASHASIGASTAVFGAVGILAATQLGMTRTTARDRRVLDIVTPLVGGLALLGALGASPTADLGAHLFGLLAGLVVGGVASWTKLRERVFPRAVTQVMLGGSALSIVLASWQLALRR
jgi:membrane associated rhomboid family serine protease